jgi:cytochrome c oxidase cbb3-type subunit III
MNWKLMVGALVLLGATAFAAALLDRHRAWERRLLTALPDQVVADPQLVRFAITEARPLYARYCAACHGPDMQGAPALGAPNLSDSTWLYGSGTVYDIERTLLYGIRSGRSKSHNITDMPAFGLTGRLSDGDIRSVVQYVLQLSGDNYDPTAANAGRRVFYGNANCSDCHGMDARGDSGYGAPDLTRNVWNSGSSAEDLYRAIYFGEHRVMPAWRGVLPLEQIRALAVYVYWVSHPPPTQVANTYAQSLITPGGARRASAE